MSIFYGGSSYCQKASVFLTVMAQKNGVCPDLMGLNRHVMQDRKSTRLKAKLRIFFSGGGVEGEGTVLDLSKSGCRVDCESEIVKDAAVAAWIYSPDYDWPLKIERAVVRWVSPKVFGLEFVEILPAQRERLRTVLNEKKLGV